MMGLVRHRQTKGLETDRPHLNHRVTPRLHTRRKKSKQTLILITRMRSKNQAIKPAPAPNVPGASRSSGISPLCFSTRISNRDHGGASDPTGACYYAQLANSQNCIQEAVRSLSIPASI